MSSDCKNKNPLQRSGVNQYQRVMKALQPAYAQIDERQAADLILFAKRYAAELKYFNLQNAANGDWSPLMSLDVSVTLAELSKADVKNGFTYVKDVFDLLKNISAEAEAKKYFKVLFDFGFSLTSLLNEQYKALPQQYEFKKIFGEVVHSSLPKYYDRLIKYYNEALAQNLIDPAEELIYDKPPIEIEFAQNFTGSDLEDIWVDVSVPLFNAVYFGSTDLLKIKSISTHNLFTSIFDNYLKTFAKLVETAATYLGTTLEDFPEHSPHYALYLTFIKLLGYARNHLNNFTKRHLDLYYKEILQLKNKEAKPDTAHVTFELQKNVQSHLLKAGTLFKGGKDIDQQEIYYSLTENIVLNTGKIKSLKNIYVKKDIAANTKQIFASPVANSEDGMGAELISEDKSWKTFGSNESPVAETGFAIASDYLDLREGQRYVIFNFYAPAGSTVNFPLTDINTLFAIQLSGKKGWIDIDASSMYTFIHASLEYFMIILWLHGGADSIVPYSAETHQYNLNTTLPVAKFIVKDALAKEAVWNFTFEKIQLGVFAVGVKDLMIQNDEGILSPSKAFDLFGASPHIDSSFIIGSKELFNKALHSDANISAEVKFKWDNYDELLAAVPNTSTYTLDVSYRENALWVSQTGNTAVPLFHNLSSANKTSEVEFKITKLNGAADYSANENYAVQSKYGFVKFDLNTEFGHSDYMDDLIYASKNATLIPTYDTTDTDLIVATKIEVNTVAEPYTPKVKELSLNYLAFTAADFSKPEQTAFFHITPFGSSQPNTGEAISLLPSFNNEGELFIGIEKFNINQTISLLFQVAEGTADPLADKQDIVWYYLSFNNEWLEFKKEDVADATDDLTNSGIIKFSISAEAIAANTLMQEELIWIKGVVKQKTNAVCKLIEVIAQAAKVQFSDYKKIGNHYKNTLPAGSISKLLISDSAIKKITQPFASVNGRLPEDDNKFYTRVSERLRHKNRSVSMWDFERMVLEEFSQVYKVKCINHTQVIETTVAGNTVYVDNELKPGYIIVVPIPDLQNKNAFDPLRPYTSLGLLTDIKKFLYQYISPHVNLEVKNPRFEEIQLEFKVKFLVDDNEFYEKQLKQELQQFLAPWAYEPSTDIEFGGKISKSSLINFIEDRGYVDFISCVKMYVIADGIKSGNVDEAIASSARSVFVSVKSDDETNAHQITFITGNCNC